MHSICYHHMVNELTHRDELECLWVVNHVMQNSYHFRLGD